jgi:hypothetical protein
MPCDHLQPEDIIQLAETQLRDRGLASDRWNGARVRHGENTPNGMWGSVVMELERRDGQWVVTRLDRNREPLRSDECGLEVVV